VPDQGGADAQAAVAARDEQEIDVQLPFPGRGDVPLPGLGDNQRAEHRAVLVLRDPHPASVRLAADDRLALVIAGPWRGTPLLGVPPGVHPPHGLIAKRQDRGDVISITRTNHHDPFLARKPCTQSAAGSGYEQAKAELGCVQSDEVAVAFGPPA
jgi:hypothetical protein